MVIVGVGETVIESVFVAVWVMVIVVVGATVVERDLESVHVFDVVAVTVSEAVIEPLTDPREAVMVRRLEGDTVGVDVREAVTVVVVVWEVVSDADADETQESVLVHDEVPD